MTADHPRDYHWLTGPEAARWLVETAASPASTTSQARPLRAALTPGRAALVLAQVELRRRARRKFSAAERMFFTARGLEQATDELVARYKARRFSGCERIVDLCAGIGGDLVELARQAHTTGIDRDPACAIYAAANAGVQRVDTRCAVHEREASADDVAACDAWHIDPDRRPSGRRTTRANLHEPSSAAIDGWLAINRHAAVKLAPAAEWPESWNDTAEFEWISRSRSCRQLVAWFGKLANDATRRRATLLDADGKPIGTILGSPGVEVPLAPRLARYLYEPDPAVLAAKLDGALAARHQIAAITPGIAYWTSDNKVDDALLAAFEVEEVLPLDVKRLKGLLREREIGRLEIKVRGVAQDPSELRRRLSLSGEREATLLLMRANRGVAAILAQRVGT